MTEKEKKVHRLIFDLITKYQEEGLTFEQIIRMYQLIYDFDIKLNWSMEVELQELIMWGLIKIDE